MQIEKTTENRSPIGTPGAALPALTLADLLVEGPLEPQQAALIGFEAARLVERAWREGRPVRVDPQSVAVDIEARVRLVPCPSPGCKRGRWTAPEVRKGAPAGASSVVWILGRLLSEMLTPSAGSHASRGTVNRRLATIAARATSPDPRRRHASVRQFAREVGAFLLDVAPELA